MDNYVLCGMQFGDEGKGTFVDYLVHEKRANAVVRYNGGSQASHTVITPDGILHKFAQLGSGMFRKDCHTYLLDNMVINPDNLMVELQVFSEKIGISIPDLLKRIHIHADCLVVTPYHKLINKMRELSSGTNRRGSVGTGVSEVKFLLEEDGSYIIPLKFKDFFDDNYISVNVALYQLQKYAENFYESHKDEIWQNCPDELRESLFKEINFLVMPSTEVGSYIRISEHYESVLRCVPDEYSLKKCMFDSYEEIYGEGGGALVYEGSQGLLIDHEYGIKPNTTHLDTTSFYGTACALSFLGNVKKIGIVKAFCSRHGKGVFPTESSELSEKLSDKNQEETFWNGKIRFGWLDTVLLRYAQRINQVDELYISSLDMLDGLEKLYLCESYIYTGKVDDKFKELFEYYNHLDGYVLVTNIKKGDDSLGEYLKLCVPKYFSCRGWKFDSSKATKQGMLVTNIVDYIKMIEYFVKVPVTLVSVGPTRENKIVFDAWAR